MEALWVAKTGLEAQQRQLQGISNNLANSNTTGFKKSRAQFADLMYQQLREPGAQNDVNTQQPSGLQMGTGVRVVGMQKVFAEGSQQVTDNPTDVMIRGDNNAFFLLTDPNGQQVYTRDGRFQVNADGNMVHAATGYQVAGVSGISTNYLAIQVSRDGDVQTRAPGSTSFSSVGQMQLHSFLNPAGLNALGNNLFEESTASGTATAYTPASTSGGGIIVGGSLEASNVNMVEEIVKMIEAQRNYEVGTRVMSTASQMMQAAAQRIN